MQLYSLKNRRPSEYERYTLVQEIGGELVMRPWPWQAKASTEFFTPAEVVEAELVEYLPEVLESPKSQPKASEKPAASQPAASQQPVARQPAATGAAGKSQLRSLDFVPEFDELAHYTAHMHVVEAMQAQRMYAEARNVSSFAELERVSTFPRPVTSALNEALSWQRSRDFYMNLYRIHKLVEAKRPVWFVEVFESAVFSIVNTILYK